MFTKSILVVALTASGVMGGDVLGPKLALRGMPQHRRQQARSTIILLCSRE